MKIWGIATAIVLFSAPCAMAQSTMTNTDSVRAHMPKHEELDDLKRKAMAGSGNAALSVSLWYMKFPSGNDTEERWTRIAAENGSAAGQFNLGLTYPQDKSRLGQIRARYWLELSPENGNPRAKEELARMKQSAP